MPELTDKQIAEKLARWMGWSETFDGWLTAECEWMPRSWNPCQSLDGAFRIQDQIAKRDLESRFIAALFDVLGGKDHGWLSWNLINATARQRCLAAVAVIGGGE